VERGERVVVGVNRFADENGSEPPLHRSDPSLERKQVDRVRAHRAGRDSTAAESALLALKDGAGTTDRNLMEPILTAARAGVTVGEMCDAFRAVWGAWRETPVF
jgi:methylmalonyl-CoA mutase N-terminal domain/subunit